MDTTFNNTKNQLQKEAPTNTALYTFQPKKYVKYNIKNKYITLFIQYTL